MTERRTTVDGAYARRDLGAVSVSVSVSVSQARTIRVVCDNLNTHAAGS